ncbi:MAG TPA: hypothetical protein VM409_07030, partial [Chloroflexia bacterium]|nr:hypothetical protein [Chloroflexia bacterium]
AIPYVEFQGAYEFKRSLFEAERFSNTLSSFLAIFRGNPVYQALLAPFADKGFWSLERAAFPGLTVLLLWVAAVRGSLHDRSSGDRKAESRPLLGGGTLPLHCGFFSLAAVLSAFLSLGPSLQLTYAASNYDPAAVQRVIPLPYALLHEWVPGFQSMRVVARIDVLTALSLSALAGIGAFYALRWVSARRWSRAATPGAMPALAVVMALLPMAESWSMPVHMEAVGTRGAVPPVYKWLADKPQTVILEYPMTNYQHGDPSVEMANLYQYYSTYHWQHTINGSTTIRPFAYSALVRETEECFPCPRSLDALWAMDVKYVVVHLENLSAPQRTDFLWRSTNPAGKVVGEFNLEAEFGNDRVYSLKPRHVVEEIKSLVSPGSSLLLGSPERDPTKAPGELVYGGYMAALGYALRDHPQQGDARLTFGQQISVPDSQDRPEFALLWAGQDPKAEGYRAEDRIWSNEHVALYKLKTGVALRGSMP